MQIGHKKRNTMYTCFSVKEIILGKTHEKLTEDLQAWIHKQHMFFVSTAPLSADGMINCSPKGLDSFRVLDEHTVAYIDLTGSGVETISHLKENGRIVVMFCAFEGATNILRLYGEGEVIEPHQDGFKTLASLFPVYESTRAIIRVHVKKIIDACGYSVPLYTFNKQRDTLIKWAENKGSDGLSAYQKQKNLQSLDGLTGLETDKVVISKP